MSATAGQQPTPYQRRRAEREAELAAKRAAAEATEPRTVQRLDLSADLRKARQAEKNRRRVESRRRALALLAEEFPEKFAAYLAAEQAGVDRERGPLPGDPA